MKIDYGTKMSLKGFKICKPNLCKSHRVSRHSKNVIENYEKKVESPRINLSGKLQTSKV